LILTYDEALSSFAFYFNLRRYTMFQSAKDEIMSELREVTWVGRSKLTPGYDSLGLST